MYIHTHIYIYMRGAVNLLHGLRTSLKYAYKNANLDYKLFMKDRFLLKYAQNRQTKN